MESEKAVRLVERGYNKIYKKYAMQRRGSRGEVNALAKLLPKGAQILDAGCGGGHITKILVSEGFNATGIDISKNMVKLAKKNVPKARFYKMDMRKLKFPSGSFDAVTCFYAIIHVPKQYHLTVLKQFNKVLRPGGMLLITMGKEPSDAPVDIVKNWMGYGAAMYWSHFGKRENISILRKAGFRIMWGQIYRYSTGKGGHKDDRHLVILARKRV